MNVFIFTPSNEFVGKLSIKRQEDLSDSIKSYCHSNNAIVDYSYVEVAGMIWTIVRPRDPFEFVEGRVPPLSQALTTPAPSPAGPFRAPPVLSWKTSGKGCKKIRTAISGGASIDAEGIRLYPEPLVAQATQLVVQASDLLAPKSSGLGYIGSFSQVMGASLLDGAVMSLINSHSQGRGNKVLAELKVVRNQMREQAALIPVDSVFGLETPEPGSWHAVAVGAMGLTRYVFDGDKFLAVATENGVVWLAWDRLAWYQVLH